MSPALLWQKLPAEFTLQATLYAARADARRTVGDTTEAARLDTVAAQARRLSGEQQQPTEQGVTP
jgi:hypothetical protein